MATVHLDRLHLSDAVAPADTLTSFTGREVTDQRSLPVEVRTMANGRTRTVTRAGSSRVLSVTLRNLTFAQTEWLAGKRGRLMLLRDRAGRKVFGVFGAVAPREYPDRSGWDVELTLTEVTYTEAV